MQTSRAAHDGRPGIHYNLVGTGRLIVGNGNAIELRPHTLIVVPGNSPFRIEVPSRRKPSC